MLAQASQVPAWVPIAALIVSLVSLGLAGWSLHLTRKRDQREQDRDRKKVEIVSSIEDHFLAIGEGIPYWKYRCTVTNTGVPGVEIRSVGLRSHGSAGAEIPLELAQGEEARVLAQGAAQVWEIGLDELRAARSGPGALDVVAVAKDTAGDEYVQEQSKSLPIPLED